MLSKRKKKVYFRLNIISILFTVVSLLSVTLAWFAYSGLASANTEIGIKAWYIEFEKDNEEVSNNIVLSIDDIYPGMDPKKEEIKIKNLGDVDAILKYKINQARILDSNDDYYEESQNMSSDYIEDVLSHDYPFHIDISLDTLYIDVQEEATFILNVTWPLDSGNDERDSLWGNKASQYVAAQNLLDPSERQPAIEVVMKVTAEQRVDAPDSIDTNFLVGKRILYDKSSGETCQTVSTTCIETHVIDTYNIGNDQYVNLLPSTDLGTGTFAQYQSINPNWNTDFRLLTATDIVKVLSLDIEHSYVKINGISDSVIGRVLTTTRANSILSNVVTHNGYFEFSGFSYLQSQQCIWTSDSYNEQGFALKNTRLYGENKNTSCRMIPVLHVLKSQLEESS